MLRLCAGLMTYCVAWCLHREKKTEIHVTCVKSVSSRSLTVKCKANVRCFTRRHKEKEKQSHFYQTWWNNSQNYNERNWHLIEFLEKIRQTIPGRTLNMKEHYIVIFPQSVCCMHQSPNRREEIIIDGNSSPFSSLGIGCKHYCQCTSI